MGPAGNKRATIPSSGTLSLWGDAPANAQMVRTEFEGEIVEEPVVDGAYLVVSWRVPPPVLSSQDRAPVLPPFAVSAEAMSLEMSLAAIASEPSSKGRSHSLFRRCAFVETLDTMSRHSSNVPSMSP
jgi:hypothetical protein